MQIRPSSLNVRRLLLLPLLAFSLALPTQATWSIVVVNNRTGEIAVASATCIQNGNLLRGLPVVLVGKGAGVAQASVDPTSQGIFAIYAALEEGLLTPPEILEVLAAQDPQHDTRQYGIVAFNQIPATFTGQRTGLIRAGRKGRVGEYTFAMQGNVLTSNTVIIEAERAFLETPGDMGQRLMAAMQAARALGGDGRCSCNMNRPNSCGAPPPNFTKSAHIGFMIVARIGDADGPCNFRGCAQGRYYMKLNIAGAVNGNANALDPVLQLQTRFDTWRRLRAGSPDGLLSTVKSVQSLPADGRTVRTVTIKLMDLDGNPLTAGGDNVTVETEDGLAPLATIGSVVDNGDGSYNFTLTAGTQVGTDSLVIRADNGRHFATLYPFLQVRSDPVTQLHVGFDKLSASAGEESVPFQLNVSGEDGALYALVFSTTGTQPGLAFRDLVLPLNPPLITILGGHAGEDMLPGGVGRLDEAGRAAAAFLARDPLLTQLIGQRVDGVAVLLGHSNPHAGLLTNSVGFDIVP